mmetsp:Transcript_34361/g.31075  ORF Transcript_34361/g.31075 Transcript_34361/m.31075 type:complete len:108 (+) Transcript_34361:370-693(+)
MSVVEAFDHVDTDKDGFIAIKDFRNLFKNLNMDFTDRELNFLSSAFKSSNHNVISKNEFVEKFWNSFTGQNKDEAASSRIRDLRSYARKTVTNLLSFFKNRKRWSAE